MSDATPPGQREFRCEHCNGKILIPVDLPPTSGPCPHCAKTITSPAKDEAPKPVPAAEKPVPAPPANPIASPVESPVTPPVQPETPAPAPEKKPAAEAKAAPPESAKPAAAPVKAEKEKPAAKEKPEKAKAKAEPAKEGKSKAPLFAAILVVLVLLFAGGGFLVMKAMRKAPEAPPAVTGPPPELREEQYLESGWEADARDVLGRFLAADTLAGKAAYAIDGGRLIGEMESIYQDGWLDDSDTPVEAFSVSPLLTLEDKKRGIFMLQYDRPPSFEMSEFFVPVVPLKVQHKVEEPGMLVASAASTGNFSQDPVRVHALFKRTPEGLRLDWESFVQSKRRTMRDFIEIPAAGRRSVFRVLVSETVPDKRGAQAGHRTYLVADPANRTEDIARVSVPVDSEVGRALSILNWRGTKEGRATIKTATIELQWSDDALPKLGISRFLCWEFLGVGGEAAPGS